MYDGWREPFVYACYMVYGLHPDKLQVARAERDALQTWELHRYAGMEQNISRQPQEELRRPTAGSGNVYEMPQLEKPEVKEPLRKVP
jgi:hypothetical protein